jgi:hypothetical protein
MLRRDFLSLSLLGATSLTLTRRPFAQDNYPSKPIGNTPQEFATFISAERQKWAEVIKAANISAE